MRLSLLCLVLLDGSGCIDELKRLSVAAAGFIAEVLSWLRSTLLEVNAENAVMLDKESVCIDKFEMPFFADMRFVMVFEGKIAYVR